MQGLNVIQDIYRELCTMLFITLIRRCFSLMNIVITVGNFIYRLDSHDKKSEVSVIRPDQRK